MKEKFPTPTRRIINAINMPKGSQGGTGFIYVAEAFTSQSCYQCKAKSLTNITSAGSKQKACAILKCNSRSTVWNYDMVTAKNIRYFFTYMSQHNNERPLKCMNSASPEDCIRTP